MATVHLSFKEIMHAAFVGVIRRTGALKDDRKPAHGYDSETPWEDDIESCLAECAISKHFGIYWSGAFGLAVPDVGKFQVRSTKHPSGHLLMHPTDKDDEIFILCIGKEGHYKLAGQIIAKDGKLEKYWEERIKNRPCFWVPQSVLSPLVELAKNE